MVYKLFADPSSKLNKILITAKYANVQVDVHHGDQAPAHATGKTPALETDAGVISETNAIIRFLARSAGDKSSLYGHNATDAGLIDQWIDFSVIDIDLPAAAWLLPIDGVIPNNHVATTKAQNDIKRVFQILDSHLLARTYLVGHRISIADIVVASSLVRLFELVLDPTFRAEFANATRWFTTVVNQPNFLAIQGKVNLAEQVAVAAQKKAEPKKEKKPAQEKPAQAPKQEKKKEEKKKEKEVDEEEEDEGEKEEKKKNPLDDLPKSTFVLDEWKRFYSNNDTRTAAIPWFHEKYDPAGYSIWWSSYLYNNELEKLLNTNNLVGGFFQRLDKLHKYAFGTLNIYGEEGNMEIHGVWVFRGPEVPADMKACDDSELYSWTKADLSDPAQKAKFEDFISWEGEVNGKKFLSGKVFK